MQRRHSAIFASDSSAMIKNGAFIVKANLHILILALIIIHSLGLPIVLAIWHTRNAVVSNRDPVSIDYFDLIWTFTFQILNRFEIQNGGVWVAPPPLPCCFGSLPRRQMARLSTFGYLIEQKIQLNTIYNLQFMNNYNNYMIICFGSICHRQMARATTFNTLPPIFAYLIKQKIQLNAIKLQV